MLRFIAPLATCIAACFAAGSAHAGDRRYAIGDFDRVIVEGPYAVTLTVGQPSSAVARGSAQAVEAVSVEVQGTTLRVRRNRGAWGGTLGRAPAPATIILTTRNLRQARVIGTGTLDLSGARGLRLDLSVEGSGLMRARALAADTVFVGLRGSGSFELAGSAKALTADLQGAGSVNGDAFSTETASIVAATAGNVSLSARRSAKVVANGVGEIVIGGTPACTISGLSAAQVRCGRQP